MLLRNFLAGKNNLKRKKVKNYLLLCIGWAYKLTTTTRSCAHSRNDDSNIVICPGLAQAGF